MRPEAVARLGRVMTEVSAGPPTALPRRAAGGPPRRAGPGGGGTAGSGAAPRTPCLRRPHGVAHFLTRPPAVRRWPRSERAQHRHQFPARGGEAVVVPRRAGLVLPALENARRDEGLQPGREAGPGLNIQRGVHGSEARLKISQPGRSSWHRC
jgi:hypothetical protein